MQISQRVALHYEVDRVNEDWVLSEERVPESSPHEMVTDVLKHLLLAWAARTQRTVKVGRNLAVRWDEAHPQIGVDPDVYVVEPPPPEGDEVTSLRLWEEGHHPLLLAVEVVSPSRAQKDYESSPEKYAASGTKELWVFDPKLAGPTARGGPFRLQVWRRDEDDSFRRVYAGEGPVGSVAVDGWLFAVSEGRSLRIAFDEAGTRWWMTAEEMARAEGLRDGRVEGLRAALRDACDLLDIHLTPERHAALAQMEVAELDALRERLKRDRRWG